MNMLRRKHYPQFYYMMLVLMAIIWSNPVFAQDRYVDPAGVDAAACDDPAAPCQTIAYTITQSVAGDTIHLISLAGVPAVFNEFNLTIPFDLAIVGQGPFQTEIDALGSGRIFSVNANLTLIDKVTLRNGNAGFTNGGAIELLAGDLIVTRSRFLDNDALAGGAIAAPAGSGDVWVSFTTMRGNNTSASGGAIWCDSCGGVNTFFSRLVENTTGGLGGAIYAMGTRVIASASYLSRNNANGGGGI